MCLAGLEAFSHTSDVIVGVAQGTVGAWGLQGWHVECLLIRECEVLTIIVGPISLEVGVGGGWGVGGMLGRGVAWLAKRVIIGLRARRPHRRSPKR